MQRLEGVIQNTFNVLSIYLICFPFLLKCYDVKLKDYVVV